MAKNDLRVPVGKDSLDIVKRAGRAHAKDKHGGEEKSLLEAANCRVLKHASPFAKTVCRQKTHRSKINNNNKLCMHVLAAFFATNNILCMCNAQV